MLLISADTVPGVFFSYEFSPFVVKVTHSSMRLASFLTSVCAIIGGVFAIAGVVDSVLYHGGNFVKKHFLKGPSGKAFSAPHAKDAKDKK